MALDLQAKKCGFPLNATCSGLSPQNETSSPSGFQHLQKVHILVPWTMYMFPVDITCHFNTMSLWIFQENIYCAISLCLLEHIPVSLLKAVNCIISLFLTQFPPEIIQDKYSVWDFYTFSACLISQITFRKARESWASHLRRMWDIRGMYICMCKLHTVNVYPLANFICIPAFKLFHPSVWSNAIGSLGMAAAGVQAGTCCVDLSEYLNGKRNSP